MAKSKQGSVNYSDLGKECLKDEIRKLTKHRNPTIRLLATFVLKVDC